VRVDGAASRALVADIRGIKAVKRRRHGKRTDDFVVAAAATGERRWRAGDSRRREDQHRASDAPEKENGGQRIEKRA